MLLHLLRDFILLCTIIFMNIYLYMYQLIILKFGININIEY
jgi:hypothetical protein